VRKSGAEIGSTAMLRRLHISRVEADRCRFKRPGRHADARRVRVRIQASLVMVATVLWMVAGLGVVALLLPQLERPGVDAMLVLVGCTLLGVLFSRAVACFQSGRQQLTVAPDAGFHVLAAVMLAPPLAALVGCIGVLHSIRASTSRLERAFLASGGALATGMASIVAHDVVGAGVPGSREVLVAATLAAITRAALALTGQLLYAELRAAGGAFTVLRGVPVPTIMLLEAGLPTTVVAMSAPFFDLPLLALGVVLAGQLLTWQLLRVQHAHFRGTRITDELLATFHRYVPRHVARRILDQGGDETTSATVGEVRDVTVMFIDIRGYTSWSERTDATVVFGELNQLLGELVDAILATDGTLDKFTGDGLMAFWNAPTDQPDHALRAVKALPKLLMRVREFNVRRELQRAEPLEVGIGIASGAAMVGNIGHRDRLSYTAIGDTVNLSARLEKATRDHDVPALIDESTFLALPTALQRQLQRLDSIEVKGRADRVRLYAPIALLRHRSSNRAA
jgi:class 3 adenylate cyclase